MFADDTCLLLFHSDFDSLIRDAIEELSNISEWFKANQLSLNIDKTNFIFFVTKNRTCNQNNLKLFIDGIKIS